MTSEKKISLGTFGKMYILVKDVVKYQGHQWMTSEKKISLGTFGKMYILVKDVVKYLRISRCYSCRQFPTRKNPKFKKLVAKTSV